MNTCTSLWNAMQQQIQLSRNITWNALRMHIFRSSLNIESVVKCCDCVLHDVLCLFSLTALRLWVFFFSHLPFGFVCIRLCWYAIYDDDAAAAAISCRCCKLCLHEYECVSCVVSFFTLSLPSLSVVVLFLLYACIECSASSSSLLHGYFRWCFAFCFLFLFHVFLSADRRFCISLSYLVFKLLRFYLMPSALVILFFFRV